MVAYDWGYSIELKYEYKNENAGEVISYKMNKKELKKHLQELEKKNKHKNKKLFGGNLYE